MKKILLASVGIIISTGTVYAACIPTPSCSSLGYESSSSCEGGIKCPFGNAWNCTLVNKITEIEKIIQEGGVGGNKNCQIGNIYYSDKSCSVSLDSSKTPIGVVVYIDSQGHGQIMALKSIGSYKWGPNNDDIPTLTNFGNGENPIYDLNSCVTELLNGGLKYEKIEAKHKIRPIIITFEKIEFVNWILGKVSFSNVLFAISGTGITFTLILLIIIKFRKSNKKH